MAVGTWLAIQQPPSLMRGAPGKELAGLNPCSGKISEWIPSTCAPEWNCEWERRSAHEAPTSSTNQSSRTSNIPLVMGRSSTTLPTADFVGRATV